MKCSLLVKTAGLLAAATCAIGTGVAHAQLAGPKMLQAFGDTMDTSGNHGHMALAGRATFDGRGSAKAIDLTLSYIDRNGDNSTCELTNPSVLSYNLTKGVGTLTLTNINGCQIGDISITFNLYVVGPQARIVATSLSLYGTATTSVAMSGSM